MSAVSFTVVIADHALSVSNNADPTLALSPSRLLHILLQISLQIQNQDRFSIEIWGKSMTKNQTKISCHCPVKQS
jgi:hypothetical protein